MDTNKPVTLPPAPLTRTDAKGIQWGYEPDQDRWFAIVNGKKTTSKEFQKVSEKVSALEVKAKTPASAAVPADIPAIKEVVVMAQNHHHKFFPILAKVEWNAAVEKYQILRYKEFKADGSALDGGWQSSHASSLRVFHPDCLSSADRQFIEASLAEKSILGALKAASTRVWDTWRPTKVDGRLTYELAFRAGQSELVTTDRFDHHSSRRQAHLSPNLPCVSLPTSDLGEWAATPEGEYRRGEVVIKLGDITSSVASPRFEVWTDRWDTPVYSGDFKSASVLGNATYDVLAQNQPPIQEWYGYTQEKTSRSSDINWPSLWEQWGGTVYTEKETVQSTVRGFTLSQELPNPLKDTAQKGYSNELPGIAWRTRSSSTSPPVFLATGPEDSLFEQLDGARKLALEFLVQEGLARRGDTNSATWWRAYNAVSSTPPTPSTQPEALQTIVGLHDDDPEAMIKDPVQLVARFNRELSRMERQVTGQEHHATVLQALSEVPRADYVPARAPRGP